MNNEQMNATPVGSAAMIHCINLVLILCGAAVALQATWYMRSHHPAVSPHSHVESMANLLLWIGIPVALIALPLVRVVKLSLPQLSLPLRFVLWSAFLAALITVVTGERISCSALYIGAAPFAYLFAIDTIPAFRSRSWLIAASSLSGLLVSCTGFLVMSWALLYAE